MLEEAIASLLIVLSPQNMILNNRVKRKDEEDVSVNDPQYKQVDGLFYTTRLLQSLGEPCVDENGYYFTCMSLYDLGLASLKMWRPQSSIRKAIVDHITRIRWLWPVLRILDKLYPDTNPTLTKPTALTNLKFMKSTHSHVNVMDIESGKLLAFLSKGLRVFRDLRRMYNLQQSNANRKKDQEEKMGTNTPNENTAEVVTTITKKPSESIVFLQLEDLQDPTKDHLKKITLMPFSEAENEHIIETKDFSEGSEGGMSSAYSASSNSNSSKSSTKSSGMKKDNSVMMATTSIALVVQRIMGMKTELKLLPLWHPTLTDLTEGQKELIFMIVWLIKLHNVLAKFGFDIPTLCR
jgi:hypothetical protein